ncbi:MAG: hypothetical protein K2O18_10440 [Oscillospiraceae bacterium]|nr:hypothetical protein [Oscillospiraceae bacterium]
MGKMMISFLLSALMAAALTACSNADQTDNSSDSFQPSDSSTAEPGDTASELTVRFGDGGTPFTLYLEDNETAAAIARHVGSADWRLPIYHFDDYEGWEVMQYYDIPSRYEIPSGAMTVASEESGQVYYSEPNRIVLFYQDAEISGEYTLVGHFDATKEFVTAVEENPVLEGWGNKIVNISA